MERFMNRLKADYVLMMRMVVVVVVVVVVMMMMMMMMVMDTKRSLFVVNTNFQQDRQCTYNLILRRVPTTTVAVEKQ